MVPSSTIRVAVSSQTRSPVLLLLSTHGVCSCPLTWHLVELAQGLARMPETHPNRRLIEMAIAQTQIDLRREILGRPFEARGVRRSPVELDRVETAIENFTEDLRALFSLPH